MPSSTHTAACCKRLCAQLQVVWSQHTASTSVRSNTLTSEGSTSRLSETVHLLGPIGARVSRSLIMLHDTLMRGLAVLLLVLLLQEVVVKLQAVHELHRLVVLRRGLLLLFLCLLDALCAC